ncbi:metal-dependent phosphohydrolase [Burkholderia plantarii]|nr:metal-dependent phosphohydrolase [Burkholderia plantarii]
MQMARRWHLPFRLHVSVLIAVIVSLIGGLISAVDYEHSRTILEDNSANRVREMSREAANEIQKMFTPASVAVKTLVYGRVVNAHTFAQRSAVLGVLHAILVASPGMEDLYVGYENGDFFMLRAIRSEFQRDGLQAPDNARFALQIIERSVSPPVGRFIYFDDALRVIKDVARPDYPASYDPRTRDWYRQALRRKRLIRTAPYVFSSVREIGTTLAMAAPDGGAVVGCDVNLDTLQHMLAPQDGLPGLAFALISADGQLVASSLRFDPVQKATEELYRLAGMDEMRQVPILARMAAGVRAAGRETGGAAWRSSTVVDAQGGRWHLTINRLDVDDVEPLYLSSAIRREDLMRSADHRLMIEGLVTLAIIVLSIPLTWLFAGVIARPLTQLAAQAATMRRFELAPGSEMLNSHISEIDRLGQRMEEMKRTIRRFLDTIQAVAAEPDFDRLVQLLLTEMLAEAHADAGVLYLANEDGTLLQPAAARDTRRAAVDEVLRPLEVATAPALIRAALAENRARAGRLSNPDIVQAGFSHFRLGTGDAAVVPLVNREGVLIGAFVLLHSAPLEQMQLSFIAELTGLFVSAIETRELIKMQRALFESFIQLIAKAIDAKSPHTGGHCNRVPELTKMLARAACSAGDGPWRDFDLNAQQWEELHVAAWLHDCGKITTPEYVIDKATKLETLYDRIHEVRMRFEVLKCEAEIRCLQAIAAGMARDEAEATRDALLRELDEEFAFVAACNEGGESMDPARVERLGRIGARTWRRTLDDRLGVSEDERKRQARAPRAPLPVRERLLADKAEHRIEREAAAPFGMADNRWGFRMPVPELLFNRGELHNLSVARGTLCDEERFKVNEHILQTIMMLSQLPFPRHMRNVPEIAGGHHEKMDGTGYPKGLRGEQMSPLARMMAIADIFEALTAADRPYKRGKTLSEAISIMAAMRQAQHIDAGLFALFLRSGVYLDYARRFMSPEQIDEVDIGRYLEPTAPMTA